MQSANNNSTEPIQFQLIVPKELAHELTVLPDCSAELNGIAPIRIQHELSLEETAEIVTILVNASNLGKVCMDIAERIHKFFSKKTDIEPRAKVIGESDETLIEVTVHVKPSDTAETIRVIVSKGRDVYIQKKD